MLVLRGRDCGKSTFTPMVAYETGDVVAMEMARSRWAIWRDRLFGFRWDVPLTEMVRFACNANGDFDMRPGAVNYAYSWTPVEEKRE
jgi:hypothetical protein